MRVAVALLALAVAGCFGGAPDDLAAGGPCTAGASTTFDATIPVLAGGGRVGPDDRHDIAIDVAGFLPDGFDLACVRAVQASITWTNTPSSGADLYLGLLVGPSGQAVVGHDQQQLVGDGTHTETVVMPQGDAGHDPALLASGLTVQVYSSWASLSQAGVPAVVSVQLLV